MGAYGNVVRGMLRHAMRHLGAAAAGRGLRSSVSVLLRALPSRWLSGVPVADEVRRQSVEGSTLAVPAATTCRTVARSVADVPGVVQLRPTAATAVLAVVSPVTDAPDTSWQPSRVRVGACGGVCVRAVDGRAEVAVHLCIDQSRVAAADRLHTAVAIASRVENRVTSVLQRTGWHCGAVDITVHALRKAKTDPAPGHVLSRAAHGRTEG